MNNTNEKPIWPEVSLEIGTSQTFLTTWVRIKNDKGEWMLMPVVSSCYHEKEVVDPESGGFKLIAGIDKVERFNRMINNLALKVHASILFANPNPPAYQSGFFLNPEKDSNQSEETDRVIKKYNLKP